MSTTSTTAAPSSSAAEVVGGSWSVRWRRWRSLVVAAAVLAVFSATVFFLQPSTSTVDLAIDNPGPNGAQALAELLRAEGIEVSAPPTVSQALDQAGPGTTVALVRADLLSDDQRRALADSGADVTVVGALYTDLSAMTGTALTTSGKGAPASTTLRADCPDPDAGAAGELAGTRGSVKVSPGRDAVGCFPVDAQGSAYAYAAAPLGGGGTLRVVADASVVANEHLTTAGNAALSVRATGHRDRLIWLDASNVSAPSPFETSSLPPWLPLLAFHAIAVAALLAFVQGRRFGRLAEEDLPVVVRSTETTMGRGRLYRQSRDHRQAALSLRAGTALRVGRRLGVPSGAAPQDLVDAVARASGLRAEAVAELFYGPPPTDAQSLTELAVQLDRLESEVSTV